MARMEAPDRSSHYLDPKRRQGEALRVLQEMVADGVLDPEHFLGTINCDGITRRANSVG